MRWKEDATRCIGLSVKVMVSVVELGAIQGEGTMNWYRPVKPALGIRMGWSFVLSNGKVP
jgi:hypothetical protein